MRTEIDEAKTKKAIEEKKKSKVTSYVIYVRFKVTFLCEKNRGDEPI
jgi:hypothetical protein